MYAQAAQDYLEEKYAEEFEINKKMNNTNAGSPIITSHLQFPEQVSYAGKSKKTGRSVEVYIFREKSDYKIKEITDDYCGEHVRKLLQNYVIDILSQELDEMKVNVSWYRDSQKGFSKNITLESSLQDLFKSSNSSDRLSPEFTIIIPDSSKFSTVELESIMAKFVHQLRQASKNYNTSSIHIASPALPDDYVTIEAESDENQTYNNKRIKGIFFIDQLYEWKDENEIKNLVGDRFSKID